MKEFKYPDSLSWITHVIEAAIKEAPCWFDFNDVRIEVHESMKGYQEEAEQYLYELYRACLDNQPLPIWQRSSKKIEAVEKPCRQCSKNNFTTDKKCWWCETDNPCK